MEPEKDTPPAVETEPPKTEAQTEQTTPPAESSAASPKPQDGEDHAPVDALSRTPEDLQAEETASIDPNTPVEPVEKKISPLKRFIRKVNVYFLIFLIIVVIGGVIAAVNYFNSQKVTPTPTVASQTLTTSALKSLANTNATVGNTSQTLTIQGNTIIGGQTLARGNLNVAGNFQVGGTIQGPSLTISGTSNLGTAQINSLQVATNTAIQGSTTLHDLNVAGISAFSGAMTASQITVSKLILSGNAVLEVPNHISFTGSSPTRTINAAVLGNGGSASINGSDTTGTLNINSGNNPTAGCFATITFQQAYTGQPHVLVSPVDAAAGQTEYYVTRTNSGFSICSAVAAPANQVFAFDYFVTD
jgi:cytoskeletal protein CcmA (bactofilin family)